MVEAAYRRPCKHRADSVIMTGKGMNLHFTTYIPNLKI